MNKKYELKTTVAELESTEFGNYHKDLKNLQHDARLAHDLLERVAFLERALEESKTREKMLKYGFNIPADGTTEQRTLKEIIRFCYTDGPMTEMFPNPEDFLPDVDDLTPEQVDAQLRMAGYTDADFDRMHKRVAAVIAECRSKPAPEPQAGEGAVGTVGGDK